MNGFFRRSFVLAAFLILALLGSWSGEILACHDHEGVQPDPCCAVCRLAGNPGLTLSPNALPSGIPVLDAKSETQATVRIPGSRHVFSSPVPRAPPTS